MKVVIPMAGRGLRFKNAGYATPKPLIKVAGKPMVIWTVGCVKKTTPVNNKDFIFVMLKEHDKKFAIGERMKELVPGSRQLFIDAVTKGAAATVYLTKNLIDPDEELFITDSDQYYKMNRFEKARKEALKKGYAGIIGTFRSKNPAYSYAAVNKKGFVSRTAEKEVISHHAAIGAYYFTRSKYFMESIFKMIKNKIMSKNEYYVCPVYNQILKYGPVTIVDAEFWMTMGTPQEAKSFEQRRKL